MSPESSRTSAKPTAADWNRSAPNWSEHSRLNQSHAEAAEGCRTPKPARCWSPLPRESVLECDSPLSLSRPPLTHVTLAWRSALRLLNCADMIPDGVKILSPLKEQHREILSVEALAFFAALQRQFNPRRLELLAKRRER